MKKFHQRMKTYRVWVEKRHYGSYRVQAPSPHIAEQLVLMGKCDERTYTTEGHALHLGMVERAED